MYGKLFTQMYDGTLATRGPWQAMVTFQQLIILADKTGIVDMTREAIARRTTIPLDIINIGITALEQTDSESRSPELEGRRIVRLSDDRDWGWQIVITGITAKSARRKIGENTCACIRIRGAKHCATVNRIVSNVSGINQ